MTILLAEQTLAVSPAAAQGVDCPDGYVVVVNDEQNCYPSASGTVPPEGSSFEVSPPRGGGGTEFWCVRHTDPDQDSRTNPARVPCNGGEFWFHIGWDCYIRHDDRTQPDDFMPRRGIGDDEDGWVYQIWCYPPQATRGGDLFVDGSGALELTELVVGPPNDPALEGTPSVIPGLWAEAVNALGMRGPEITTAPPVEGSALVNLPVWLWTDTGGNVWPDEPLHEVAAAPEVGQQVDAFAEPLRIEWDMGDGQTVTCEGPGDAWAPGITFLPPSDCHHVYRRTSRHEPGGTYEIIAITTWRVWWWINGDEDGELEIEVGSTLDYQVDEIQVLSR